MQEKDTSLHTSPQLAFVEHNEGFAVALSPKQTVSLYKKSKQSSIPFEILEEVYRRGFNQALELGESVDSYAFNRVNSFIAGGAAAEMDKDLMEKRGLWDNIHAKRERIKRGSGERMRKPGEKGAPTAAALKASQTEDTDPCWNGYKQVGMKTKNGRQVPNCVPESYTGAETVSVDKNDPSSRFIGTESLTNVYKNDTPGQGPSKTLSVIKKVVREQLEADCKCGGNCQCDQEVTEATYKGKTVPLNKPMKGDVKKSKVYVDPDGDGKAQKVNFGDKNLSIKKDQPERKKSYCARSGGIKGTSDKTSANYWSRKAWDC